MIHDLHEVELAPSSAIHREKQDALSFTQRKKPGRERDRPTFEGDGGQRRSQKPLKTTATNSGRLAVPGVGAEIPEEIQTEQVPRYRAQRQDVSGNQPQPCGGWQGELSFLLDRKSEAAKAPPRTAC